MRGTALVVVAVLLSIGASAGAGAEAGLGGPAAGAHGLARLVSPAVQARLRRIAREVAKVNADPAVRRATVVLATRQHAAGGDVAGSNQPVYELVLRGHFRCAALCSWRPGGRAPRGDVVTVTIDRASFQMTDLGIGDRLPSSVAGCAPSASAGSGSGESSPDRRFPIEHTWCTAVPSQAYAGG